LFLREVLLQNGRAIFGPSAFVTGREIDFQETAFGRLDWPEQDAEATALFSLKMLVSAVILTGIDSHDFENAQEVNEAYLSLCESYDRGDDEFADFLRPSAGDALSKRLLDEDENSKAWVESYNIMRNKHPVLSEENARRKADQQRGIFHDQSIMDHIVAPTSAAHLTILEEQVKPL
jgi:hypothetical protein